MNDSSTTSPLAEFKNRSTGLIAFGILEILLGCLCALLVPLMLFGQAMSAQMTGGAPNYRMVVPGGMMYGMLAVAFIWLGIGSIRFRRWARALLLILSWSWLVTGVIAVGFLVYLFPRMTEALPPGGASVVAFIAMAAMWSIMFIVVPGILVIFYQSKHVKATCEARDPVSRWTDRCPSPVLAVTLCLASGAVVMCGLPVIYNSVLPFFGVLLSGLPGTLACLFLSALWAYLAWAWYRLKPMAWWITLGVLLVFSISNIMTFTQVDLMDMYRMMGCPPEQIALIEKYNFLSGKAMVWWSACFMLPLFGYLIWMKKFFRRAV
jgi:hypothetical protein